MSAGTGTAEVVDGVTYDFGSAIDPAAQQLDVQASSCLVPVTASVAQMNNTDVTKVSARDMLDAEQNRLAEEEARRAVARFLTDTAYLSDYGFSAMTEANQFMTRLMNRDDGDLPAVTDMMKNMRRQMYSIKKGVDLTDPSNARLFAKIDGAWMRVVRFITRTRDSVEYLRVQTRSLNGLLNDVEVELLKQTEDIKRTIAEYDEMLVKNENLIVGIIAVIARLEYARDIATTEMRRLKQAIDADKAASVPGAGTHQDGRQMQLQIYANIADTMNRRRAEFLGQFLSSCSTSAEVILSRDNLVGMVQLLLAMRYLTLYRMRATVTKWRKLKRGQVAAAIAQSVIDFSSDMTVLYGEALGAGITESAKIVHRPSLEPRAVLALVSGLDKASSGIEAAMQEGARKREELERTIAEALPRIEESVNRVVRAISDQADADDVSRNQATSVNLTAAARRLPPAID